jgi:hypothetical protein
MGAATLPYPLPDTAFQSTSVDELSFHSGEEAPSLADPFPADESNSEAADESEDDRDMPQSSWNAFYRESVIDGDLFRGISYLTLDNHPGDRESQDLPHPDPNSNSPPLTPGHMDEWAQATSSVTTQRLLPNICIRSSSSQGTFA